MRKKHVRDYVVDASAPEGYRYIGEYYIDQTEATVRKKIGLTNILIGIVEFLLIILSLSINCVGVRTIYVVIPLEITMVCVFLYMMGGYTYRRVESKMEKRHYEDSVLRMVQMSMVSFVLNLCSILGQLYIVFKGYYFTEKYMEVVLLAILMVLGVMNYYLWIKNRKVIQNVNLTGGKKPVEL